MVRFVIVGIGLNINMGEHEIDDEIKDKATSLLVQTKKPFERAHGVWYSTDEPRAVLQHIQGKGLRGNLL